MKLTKLYNKIKIKQNAFSLKKVKSFPGLLYKWNSQYIESGSYWIEICGNVLPVGWTSKNVPPFGPFPLFSVSLNLEHIFDDQSINSHVGTARKILREPKGAFCWHACTTNQRCQRSTFQTSQFIRKITSLCLNSYCWEWLLLH